MVIQCIARLSLDVLNLNGLAMAVIATRLIGIWVLGRRILDLTWGEMGLTWPRCSKKEWALFLGVLVGVCLAAAFIMGLGTYRVDVEALNRPYFEKLGPFTLFVVSTTVPWELLHRGLLLSGMRRGLAANGWSLRMSNSVAVMATMLFEVVFHLHKPWLEVTAIAVGSPALSCLALRTRSVLLPMIAHVVLEFVFFFVVLA